MSRLGAAQPAQRWVSGSYPLIHPRAKSLGGAHIRAKVLLDLQPAGAPPPRPPPPPAAQPAQAHVPSPPASDAAPQVEHAEEAAARQAQPHAELLQADHARMSESSLQHFARMEAAAHAAAPGQHDWLRGLGAAAQHSSVAQQQGSPEALELWAGSGNGCDDREGGQSGNGSRGGSASYIDGFWGLGDGEVLLEGTPAESPQPAAAELDDELALFRCHLAAQSLRGWAVTEAAASPEALGHSLPMAAAALGSGAFGSRRTSANLWDTWGLDSAEAGHSWAAETAGIGQAGAALAAGSSAGSWLEQQGGGRGLPDLGPASELYSPDAASSECFLFSSAPARGRTDELAEHTPGLLPEMCAGQPFAADVPGSRQTCMSAAGADAEVFILAAKHSSAYDASCPPTEPFTWQAAKEQHVLHSPSPGAQGVTEQPIRAAGRSPDKEVGGVGAQQQAQEHCSGSGTASADSGVPVAVAVLLQQAVEEQTEAWLAPTQDRAAAPDYQISAQGSSSAAQAPAAGEAGVGPEPVQPGGEEPDLGCRKEPDLTCRESLDLPPCRPGRAPRPRSQGSAATSVADAASPPADLRSLLSAGESTLLPCLG